MSFSGGVYSLQYNWTSEAASPPIEIAKLDTEMSGIATGLSSCLLRDGTGLPTASIPFNSQKITGLGNATLAQDAVTAIQVQTGPLLKLNTVAGTADVITANLTPALAAYVDGQVVILAPSGTNTITGVTININGLGAKTIKKSNNVALDIGDLVAAVRAILVYDGTNFVLQNPQLVGTPNTSASEQGFKGLPQNSQTGGNYTCVLSDAGKHVRTAGALTVTIPAHASVPYDNGTVLTIINDSSTTTATIAINSQTMYLAGAGTTGSRTLAVSGIATAIKITSTYWYITGNVS